MSGTAVDSSHQTPLGDVLVVVPADSFLDPKQPACWAESVRSLQTN